MRAFLAIELSEDARKEIIKIKEHFRNINAKFVEQENLHLTLKFLGEISDFQVNQIKEQLKQIKFNKFQASLGNLGFFSPSFIRVLWVALEPRDKVVELHNLIDDALEKIKIRRDKQFESHATIARIKAIKDKDDFLKRIKEISVKPVSFEVASFVLKKSTLTEKGPVYEDVLRFELT